MSNLKINIEYTAEDLLIYKRNVFLQAYLQKHLNDNPELKRDLETKFKRFIESNPQLNT